MNIKLVPLAVLFLFLCSCRNKSSAQAIKQESTVSQDAPKQDEGISAIELNQGEKWKVVPEMLLHIRNMESDVISFSRIKQGDYKSLSGKLQSGIELLTSNCTMKGKAHDELHKWLLPYIELVGKLSDAKEEAEAEKQFQNIQTSFTTFNHYFQ